jgi:hypothetical protein
MRHIYSEVIFIIFMLYLTAWAFTTEVQVDTQICSVKAIQITLLRRLYKWLKWNQKWINFI